MPPRRPTVNRDVARTVSVAARIEYHVAGKGGARPRNDDPFRRDRVAGFMSGTIRDGDAVDAAIAALESAEAGSRELDAMIAGALGYSVNESHKIVRLLVAEGYSWKVISEIVGHEVRSFTDSLDAALPGENVVLAMYSPRRGQWAALHRAADGQEILAWAGTEILARRAAALRALRAAEDGADNAAEAPPPRLAVDRPAMRAAASAAPAEELEWKILF